MATFTFNKHVFANEYPTSGAQIQFGRGYQFATKPRGPDQELFTLSFDAMWFYTLANGNVDRGKNPTINMQLLEDFYLAHRLYEKFVYPHDLRGNLNVRFKEPLSYKILKGGRGQVEPFQVKLVFQP